ncbi:MAG: universal stress protein [Rhodospirillales bacterium]|jgi:nucleotide-binding universal stress UspA family protein|nr:universal stress protein [Rhodospirillales bacterium]MBT4005726.1 universal stress protein [Rhodospirillales bacterium]MBT5077159.1 universal stress protein [Rhodospirillales bacterium]MBT5113381.1 universal stress protein [Rhodospirillales bacterium]MBT5672207.1 universal stress protein [Rhodospirillales bacterium]
MALNDILVHIDSSPAAPAQLDYAVRLAEKHEAHLSALYVIAIAPIHQYTEADLGPELIEAHDRFMRESAAEAKAMFDARVANSSITAEWRQVEGAVPEMVVLHSRYADLAVLGQRIVGRLDAGAAPELPDHVVLDVGRPAVVVPHSFEPQTIGSRVLLAWNASRDAARAANDALPILQAADDVRVMIINPEKGIMGHGELPGADIATHLARHGVKAEVVEVTAGRKKVGDELLSQINAFNADFMVMGSYGSFRLRELVFGGTTRRILEAMTVPILMSR